MAHTGDPLPAWSSAGVMPLPVRGTGWVVVPLLISRLGYTVPNGPCWQVAIRSSAAAIAKLLDLPPTPDLTPPESQKVTIRCTVPVPSPSFKRGSAMRCAPSSKDLPKSSHDVWFSQANPPVLLGGLTVLLRHTAMLFIACDRPIGPDCSCPPCVVTHWCLSRPLHRFLVPLWEGGSGPPLHLWWQFTSPRALWAVHHVFDAGLEDGADLVCKVIWDLHAL